MNYDLEACLEHNEQDFAISDIKQVLAVWEGENDEDDWRWVIQLKDCRFVFLQGGCDYTGWDCQSWAISKFAKDTNEAVRMSLGDIEIEDSHPADAGLGHMIGILSGNYMGNSEEVYHSLLSQVRGEKDKTWREMMDEEFGVDSINDSK